MGTFSAKRIGNWTFSVAGHVFPLEADLVGRVKHTVPNRTERRQAERRGRAAGKSGDYRVSPAARADAGSRERLDPPATTPTGPFANASAEFSQAVLDSEASEVIESTAGAS